MADSPPTINEPLFLVKGLGLVISFFIGIFAVFFFIWKGNYDASSCALVLEVVCVALLNMNTAYKKGTLRQKFRVGVMTLLMVIGAVAGASMLVSMIFYTYKAIDAKEGFRLDRNGYGPPALLAGMSSFWGAILFVDGVRFKAILENRLSPI